MSRERSLGSHAGERDDRGGDQRDVPDQVARGAGVGALVDRSAVREQAREREQRERAGRCSASVVPTDSQASRGSPVARAEQSRWLDERGADDADGQARGHGGAGAPSPPGRGTNAATTAITRHAPTSRNVTETDGRAVSSGDMWPNVGCALDAI